MADKRARRFSAQALIWMALTLPLFMSIAGLAIDGGLLLTARRQLQSVADGAARAGATRLDVAHVRDSAGAEVQLDADLAAAAAHTYFDDAMAGTHVDWQSYPDLQVEVGPRRVSVVVYAGIKTAFLRIVHIDNAPVEASAFADIQSGIHQPGD
jgi:uncharacterized membrane protein